MTGVPRHEWDGHGKRRQHRRVPAPCYTLHGRQGIATRDCSRPAGAGNGIWDRYATWRQSGQVINSYVAANRTGDVLGASSRNGTGRVAPPLEPVCGGCADKPSLLAAHCFRLLSWKRNLTNVDENRGE